MNLGKYIYVYYIKDDLIIFRCSVDRLGLGPNRAKQIVEEYRAKNIESFYTIGRTVPGALS